MHRRHAWRARWRRIISIRLRSIPSRLATMGRGLTIGFCWPIKNKPGLRGLMTRLQMEGADIALPVVEKKARPLVYRRWTPDARMMRVDWNSPVPPAGARVIRPDVMLAPLVGWDAQGYGLGYGASPFGPRPSSSWRSCPTDRPLLAWAPGTYGSISSPSALKAPDETPVVLLELNRHHTPSTKL